MSKFSTEMDTKLRDYGWEENIIFVGTADTDGRVNLSTKSMGSLKIIKANQLI